MSVPDALVYVDLEGRPRFAGRLWIHSRGSSQTATFRYDASWIAVELVGGPPSISPRTAASQKPLPGIGPDRGLRSSRPIPQKRHSIPMTGKRPHWLMVSGRPSTSFQ